MLHQYYGIPKDAKFGEEFMSRFPILFQDRKKSMDQTCMCWGIECPLGWYHILEQLCTILEFHNMEFVKNHGLAIVGDQVKEKFGTLRFYYTVRDVDKNGMVVSCDGDTKVATEENRRRIAMEYIEMLADKYIAEAECMTEATCAECGTPLDKDNKVETKGWISFICKECDVKRRGEVVSEDVCCEDEEDTMVEEEPKLDPDVDEGK